MVPVEESHGWIPTGSDCKDVAMGVGAKNTGAPFFPKYIPCVLLKPIRTTQSGFSEPEAEAAEV